MLYTNLKHIVNARGFTKIIAENENVMVICGGMDAGCIAAYRVAEELEEKYRPVKFYDLEIENPDVYFFHELHAVSALKEIPFILYFKKGELVKATEGTQTKDQVMTVLDHEFDATLNAMSKQMTEHVSDQ